MNNLNDSNKEFRLNLPFKLKRNSHGRLIFIQKNQEMNVNSLTQNEIETETEIIPVRSFPISSPNESLSLMSLNGAEMAFISDFSQLQSNERELIEEEFKTREFHPEILQLQSVSTFSTPSTWQVQTNRGDFQFVLKTEEDIRRLPDGRLLIQASEGILYIIKDVNELNKHSKRLLERFL